MSNVLEGLFYSKVGQSVMGAVGVKPPLPLHRYEGQSPWVNGTTALAAPANENLAEVLQLAQVNAQVLQSEPASPYDALLFDATEFKKVADLELLKTFFAQAAKSLKKSGHIVLIGLNPEQCDDTEQASIMDALTGFTRSYAKEMGRKVVTVNLIYVDHAISPALCTPLNFLLSNRATYISGQPIYVNGAQTSTQSWDKPLAGKLALVTGAAQGIGAAIAHTLARDGATVIGLDIPPAKEALAATLAPLNGISVATDITSEQAVEDIIQALDGKKLDILVHNAGVTRDKTLARMPEHFWQMTLNINLNAPISITQALDNGQHFSDDARVICISSISGIAGNVGQTNYAASKSGIAGFVRKQSTLWSDSGKTINAIAPGFIETQMTDDIPFMTREIGRRMNSMSQGGKPQDVAEGVTLFAQPGSNGLNGQLLRVCGQSLIGA